VTDEQQSLSHGKTQDRTWGFE